MTKTAIVHSGHRAGKLTAARAAVAREQLRRVWAIALPIAAGIAVVVLVARGWLPWR